KDTQPDYSKLAEIGIKIKERELNVGDMIVRNGRTYRLNANHRWERVSNEELKQEYLDEEMQNLLGIKTWAELEDLRNDTSRMMELSREQLAAIDKGLAAELNFYASGNMQKDEMLKRGVMIGRQIKEFQKLMQEGRKETWYD